MVVKEPLWPELMEAGKKLTQQLDTDGFPVHASLWFYIPDANQWRLLIASPIVDTEGPKKAYEGIRESLSKDPTGFAGLSLQNITVLSPQDPLIRLLRFAVRLPGIGSVRFTRNRVNNVYIEDAYIYRTVAESPR